MSFSERIQLFHDLATQATGLDDFGDRDYRQPMELLLSDVDEFNQFSELGVEFMNMQITGLLISRLKKVEGLKQNPDALATPIQRPIFIIGMARTGTTVLHRILTEDPTVQSLPFWLAHAPKPRTSRESWESDPDFIQIQQAFTQSVFFGEEQRKLHPVYPDRPDECRWSIDQTFWDSTIMLNNETPNYSEWYHTADVSYAYEYHRQLLSVVANGDSRRWVLKDPSHCFGIDSLLKVFPDACIVQTHREPFECVRSIANLVWQMRKRVQIGVTAEENAQLSLYHWSKGLNKMERIRRQHPEKFFDVHMNEIRQDPVGTIERIYEYFHLPITTEARQSWQQQVLSDPGAGHDSGGTNPPDSGLTKDNVNKAMALYYERYQEVAKKAQGVISD
jgi:hypothetical protein